MSDSAPYRIWKRFHRAQVAIRTALCAICTPPECSPGTPENNQNQNQNQNQAAASTDSTLAHLAAAFAVMNLAELNPIAAFQVTFQNFFI